MKTKEIIKTYICPMHPEVTSDNPGRCPKCGMKLVETEIKMPVRRSLSEGGEHKDMDHGGHVMKPVSEMSFWEKFKMSMGMTMGMEHTGLAGREMAKMMEEDIRNKFFVSLILTIPIVLYSPLGMNLLGLRLPEPIPGVWIMFLLTTFVLFGHWMEMKSRRGTTDALQALFNLVPPQARVLRDGKELLVPTSEVKIGDVLILKPGDKVPVDGVILDGETAIDESLVTGESLPVSKKRGDLVIGWSINTSGSVRFKATKVGEDTALAQIVKMVETAQNSKAPGQKLADKFAKYLVIVAVGGGLLTFLVWFFILGQPLLFALTFAISTVVIACPDALGLATPTAVAVGTGLGAKHNILIKDAPTLEQE